MDVLDRFVMGEMSLEDAMLAAKGSERVRVWLTLRDRDAIVGVQEQETAPVFTRVPVGLDAGLGLAADHVFHALDALPPWDVRGDHQPVHPRLAGDFLVSDVLPALVGALTALAKEELSHADR